MCLGIPGRIVELATDRPDFARVDVEGVMRDVNVALMDEDPPQPGDWVLIHLGFALQSMTEDEVADARSTLTVLGEGDGAGDDFVDPFADTPHRDGAFAPAGHREGPS